MVLEKHYTIEKEKPKYCFGSKIKNREGFSLKPKNQLRYGSLKVCKLNIESPYFINNLLKRKVKRKLDFYFNYLITYLDDGTDDGTTDLRHALNDLTRYRGLVMNKYRSYLDEKYYELLLKKLTILEIGIKQKIALEKVMWIEEKKELQEEKEEFQVDVPEVSLEEPMIDLTEEALQEELQENMESIVNPEGININSEVELEEIQEEIEIEPESEEIEEEVEIEPEPVKIEEEAEIEPEPVEIEEEAEIEIQPVEIEEEAEIESEPVEIEEEPEIESEPEEIQEEAEIEPEPVEIEENPEIEIQPEKTEKEPENIQPETPQYTEEQMKFWQEYYGALYNYSMGYQDEQENTIGRSR